MLKNVLPLNKNEKGSAVIFVMMLLAILAVLPVTMSLMKISNDKTKLQLSMNVQADNVARAGLIDAIDWFRRQTTQPVRSTSNPSLYPYPDAAFYPRTSTNTATSDTLDESIGLVKEYELSEASWLYARYEVKRQANTSSNPVDPHAVHDVTDRRVQGYSAGDGLCWYVESLGYVYRRRDPNVAFDQSPNEIVAKSRVSTEIRRLGLNPPVQAAVIVDRRNTVTLNANGRIAGGNFAGLGYRTGSSPTVSGSGATLTGTPAQQSLGSAFNTTSVFGVTETDLKLMADIAVTTTTNLPEDYPSMSLVYIEGNATFDGTRQLRGGGVLYVKGNLTLTAASNTFFSGLIYVTGNVSVTGGPCYISGILMSLGSVTMTGGADVSTVIYDSSILSSIRQQIGQYRENKASYHIFTPFK